MAYSMTKHEFMNIMIQRKIRERFKPFKGGLKVNQYQDVVGECWESKFNYKPNWDGSSSNCTLEKKKLRNDYNRVIAKYTSNVNRSIRPLSFGFNNDIFVSMEKYPILFKKPEPVTESQKKYHAALKALEMKFNEAKKELEQKFMEAKCQLDKKFGIVTPPFEFGYHHCH